MNTSRRVVLILLVVCLLGGVITGSQFYYRLAYFWLLLLIFSYLMSRLALRGIHFRRTARFTRSQVGQIYEERFEIQNSGRILRLWLEVKDESLLPGSRGSQVISMLKGRENRTYVVRTRLTTRGVFPLGATVLASGDLFGLFHVSQVYPANDSLLVYPMMVDIHAFPNPVGWLSGGEALRRRTQQITANASGVREYASGDPLNRIHWLSTARRNRLIVKEFELDPLSEVWMFIDANQSVQFSLPQEPLQLDERDMWRPSVRIPLPPSTEEYSVSAAASLARYYLQNERIIGLVSAGRNYTVISAEKGGRQLGKILEALALFKADGKIPLQGLVEAQARNLPRGSTVVMITPAYGDGVSLSVELLSRSGMRPIVVMIDAESFGGPTGNIRVMRQLELMGVPVCRVAKGDDLGQALSSWMAMQPWR
jgi:uncharacterized protein (DUF58 family)